MFQGWSNRAEFPFSASAFMQFEDESKKLVKAFSDKSRKVTRQGDKFFVPHKFKKNGDVVREDNFDQSTDLSKLNQRDLTLLVLWKENKWSDEETLKKCNLPLDQAEKTLKRLQHFKTEDARIKALASEATPERVLAKDVENLELDNITDSQHKSLDRIAKATGLFKAMETGGNTINIFNIPKMTPEAEAAIRAIADKEADVVDTTAI